MHLKIAFALAALTASTAASAMPVSTFMTKADGLRAKGPFALLSGDLKLLTNQIKADSLALRADNQAAERAGKGKAYCTPAAGVSLSEKDILAAMQAVPAPQRTSTSTKDALRAFLARRYPCPR
jgi:hypothetical protein